MTLFRIRPASSAVFEGVGGLAGTVGDTVFHSQEVIEEIGL